MSDNNEGEEVVWWLKWGTRAVGAAGAVAAGVCGILGRSIFCSKMAKIFVKFSKINFVQSLLRIC